MVRYPYDRTFGLTRSSAKNAASDLVTVKRVVYTTVYAIWVVTRILSSHGDGIRVFCCILTINQAEIFKKRELKGEKRKWNGQDLTS